MLVQVMHMAFINDMLLRSHDHILRVILHSLAGSRTVAKCYGSESESH